MTALVLALALAASPRASAQAVSARTSAAPSRLPIAGAPSASGSAAASGPRSVLVPRLDALTVGAAPAAVEGAAAAALGGAYDNAAAKAAAVSTAKPVLAPAASAPRAAFLAPAAARSAAAEHEWPAPPPAPKTPIRWKAAVPNGFTALNLLSGFASLVATTHGLFPVAAGLIALSAFWDMFDGASARALKVDGPFGVNFDSIADVVSFGAAPALLLFEAALGPLGAAGFVAAGAFALAGAFRLARFNAHALDPNRPHTDDFTGLPIPAGAIVAMSPLAALTLLPPAWAGAIAAGVVVLAAGAMASRLPYPAFKAGGLKAKLKPALVALAVAAPLAAAGLWAAIPVVVSGLYLAVGPLRWLWRGGSEVWRRELKRKSFHQLAALYLLPYFMLGPRRGALTIAATAAAVLAAELHRLSGRDGGFWERLFGGITRPKEAGRFTSGLYLALGVALTALLFAAHPVLVAGAVLALIWGDAASPLVGMRFGWLPFKVRGVQRSVDGALAGFAVVLAIGLALGLPLLAAAGAALAFSVADTYPVKPDDNFWIPVVWSVAAWLLGAR